jgi:hypothetical protein
MQTSAAEFMNGGAMNVPTKHAVHPIALGVFNHRRLKLSDVIIELQRRGNLAE